MWKFINGRIGQNGAMERTLRKSVNEISTDPITKAEIRTVLRKMKNEKAGDKDKITAELLKADFTCKLIQRIGEELH